MEKSPIDELFFELYGYYPNKSGQSFEMIVAAAFKLLLKQDIGYNQFLRGNYSDTVYQLDGIVNGDDIKSMIEAKDYTIDEAKVGRSDIQKLQGALTDLPVNKGIIVTATDFTKPAKKYAESSNHNPMQKPIEHFIIRPSTQKDETGRINKIVINMSSHTPDYTNCIKKIIWSKNGESELVKDGYSNKPLNMVLEKFYTYEGLSLITIAELTKFHTPGTTWEKNFISKGCWYIKGGYLKLNDKLYSVIGVEYEVPFRVAERELVIENEGTPRLFIQNADGSIDTLISDSDLKKVKFKDGRVELEP